jgi:hypothetical protein
VEVRGVTIGELQPLPGRIELAADAEIVEAIVARAFASG